jgi:hypothetical protein
MVVVQDAEVAVLARPFVPVAMGALQPLVHKLAC